jgi:hypothetical protein
VYDLKLSLWLDAVKSSQTISHVNLELIFNLSRAVSDRLNTNSTLTWLIAQEDITAKFILIIILLYVNRPVDIPNNAKNLHYKWSQRQTKPEKQYKEKTAECTASTFTYTLAMEELISSDMSYLSIRQHSVTIQKTTAWIFTTVITSNLIIMQLLSPYIKLAKSWGIIHSHLSSKTGSDIK